MIRFFKTVHSKIVHHKNFVVKYVYTCINAGLYACSGQVLRTLFACEYRQNVLISSAGNSRQRDHGPTIVARPSSPLLSRFE